MWSGSRHDPPRGLGFVFHPARPPPSASGRTPRSGCFGSRVDDDTRGGDIELYVELSQPHRRRRLARAEFQWRPAASLRSAAHRRHHPRTKRTAETDPRDGQVIRRRERTPRQNRACTRLGRSGGSSPRGNHATVLRRRRSNRPRMACETARHDSRRWIVRAAHAASPFFPLLRESHFFSSLSLRERVG